MEARITRTEHAIDAFLTSGNSPTVQLELDGWTPEVCYQLAGTLDGELVVVLGGISAGRHLTSDGEVAGWWDSQVGPGRPIDPARHAVLSLDFLAGPGSPRPPGRVVSTQDQARALAAVLDAIGREQIDCFVGASYGGMVALAFAELFPGRCRRLVLLCAAHRAHPMSTAWRSLQRRIARLGDGEPGVEGTSGLELARALAMTTYRSAGEFEARFDGEPVTSGDALEFPVESYLLARGRDFSSRFDTEAFVALSESIDAHRVDPDAISTPVCLVACDSDALVPPWLVEELRDRLAGPVDYELLASVTGHDAFLTEEEAVGAVLRRVLGNEPDETSQTRTVRASVGSDRAYGAVMPPIYLSSNYTFESLGVKREHDYTRTSNPTRDQLAEALADLEGGAGAVVTSSGMSAIALVLQLLRPRHRLLATNDCYGGLHRAVTALSRRGDFDAAFVDLTGDDAARQISEACPRMVWVETPSNPLLRITDLRAVAAATHDVGGLLVVDNTLLSPACQRPLECGADIVVHSTTKFINGHSDVVGGTAIAADPAIAEELAWWANCLGLAGAPFDSYLTLRGLRTLHVRTGVHEANAAALAQLLAEHEATRCVYYPGLAAHPGHLVARRQQDGFGSMLSFELEGGERAVRALLTGLRCFALAESLGGVESLIAHPATMTHAAMEEQARRAAGIGDSLLRLSVGIEAADDLVRDLRSGLDRAARTLPRAAGASR